jgi:hypothetical protein
MARPKRKIEEIQETPENVSATDRVMVEATVKLAPFGYAYFIGDRFTLTKEEAKKLFDLGIINYRY